MPNGGPDAHLIGQPRRISSSMTNGRRAAAKAFVAVDVPLLWHVELHFYRAAMAGQGCLFSTVAPRSAGIRAGGTFIYKNL